MANERRIGGTIAILGATAVAVVGVLFGVLYWSRPETPPAPNTAPAQASIQPSQAVPGGGPLAGASPADPAPGKPTAAAPAPAPETAAAPAEAPLAPSFDVVRVEPDGESVIAGRSAPGATIELLRGDQVHARGVADASGLFAIIPPPLPPGSHQIVLQSIAPDGARQRSRESVTVVINPDKTRPLVALVSPDKPTVLLSNPEIPEAKSADAKPSAPGAADPKTSESKTSESKASDTPRPAQQAETPGQPAPQQQASAVPTTPPAQPAQSAQRPQIKIVTVDAEEGKLFVSGLSAPGATIRLYLNESLIAPGGAGGDGKVSFAIGSGVKPGDYRVRLDDVDPVSGQVRSRAEVVFNVPVQVASAAPQTQPARQAAPAAPPQPVPAMPAAGARTGPTDTQVAAAGTIVIPSINTAFVARGDNLWRISQRIYGKGYRYTEIYGANQQQIRNPHLIYPGQVFVLPGEQVQPGNQSQAD